MIIALGSCEQKELKDYDGPESVYFFVQHYPEGYVSSGTISSIDDWVVDSVSKVEFVKLGAVTRYETLIRVKTTGATKNYDRTFRMKIDTDSTTAVEGMDYEAFPLEGVISANTIYTDIPITLLRNVQLQTSERQLVLQLLPTDDFTLDFSVWRGVNDQLYSHRYDKLTFNATRHAIRVNDIMPKPSRWPTEGTPTLTYKEGDGYFGMFSQKKLLLICEQLDLTYDYFTSAETMSVYMCINIAVYMSEYLKQQYLNRTPVLEEDGRLMWFLYCQNLFQSSGPGVPWDGTFTFD
jgi:hypothetical protein